MCLCDNINSHTSHGTDFPAVELQAITESDLQADFWPVRGGTGVALGAARTDGAGLRHAGPGWS